MKNPPLVIICGSNQQGGAEAQLCKLIESFQDFKIYLLIFSKNNNYGFFKKLIPIKEISLFNFNLYFPINTFRVLYKILKVISKSNQKTILMGWLAKGNLLALLYRPFQI